MPIYDGCYSDFSSVDDMTTISDGSFYSVIFFFCIWQKRTPTLYMPTLLWRMFSQGNHTLHSIHLYNLILFYCEGLSPFTLCMISPPLFGGTDLLLLFVSYMDKPDCEVCDIL